MRTMTVAEFKKLKKGKPRFSRSPASERTMDGVTFDSQSELTRYLELKAMRGGRVKWFIRQPIFDLCGVVYRADFLIVWRGTGGEEYVGVEEVKGKFTGRFRQEALRRWKRNAAQVQELYGIEIQLVER